MKVDDPNTTGMTPNSVGGGALERAHQAGGTARKGSGGTNPVAGDSTDSVSLSGLSAQLRTLNLDSPQRLERMEKLSLEVQGEVYNVDPWKLSHVLVESAIRPGA